MKPFILKNIKALIGEPFIVKDQQGNQLTTLLTDIKEVNRGAVISFSAIFEFVAGGLFEDGSFFIEHSKIEPSYFFLSLKSSTEFEILVNSLKE